MNQRTFLWIAVLLGPLAVVEPRISVFALLGLVVALASTTRLTDENKARYRWLLAGALLLALGGMFRFIMKDALPGIVAAGGRASNQRAVSRLREILFAQDASRRHGLIDPDGNGIGGAGRLAELTGAASARGSISLPTPPLAPSLAPRVPTREGPATQDGDFLLLVCVPSRSGGFTARTDEPVDEHRAERRFVAYAWPAIEAATAPVAYFIDEHERILESDNRAEGAEGGLRLVGPGHAPRCDDALAEATRGSWSPWREKKPRTTLPGLPSSE